MHCCYLLLSCRIFSFAAGRPSPEGKCRQAGTGQSAQGSSALEGRPTFCGACHVCRCLVTDAARFQRQAIIPCDSDQQHVPAESCSGSPAAGMCLLGKHCLPNRLFVSRHMCKVPQMPGSSCSRQLQKPARLPQLKSGPHGGLEQYAQSGVLMSSPRATGGCSCLVHCRYNAYTKNDCITQAFNSPRLSCGSMTAFTVFNGCERQLIGMSVQASSVSECKTQLCKSPKLFSLCQIGLTLPIANKEETAAYTSSA